MTDESEMLDGDEGDEAQKEVLREINRQIGDLAIQLMDRIKDQSETEDVFTLTGISNLGIIFTGAGVTHEGRSATLTKRVFKHDEIDRVLGALQLHVHDLLTD